MFNVCLINSFGAVLGRPLTSKVKTGCAFFMRCNDVTVCADVHFHLSGSQCEVFLVCASPSRWFWFLFCICVRVCVTYSRHCFTTSVRMAMSAFIAHQRLVTRKTGAERENIEEGRLEIRKMQGTLQGKGQCRAVKERNIPVGVDGLSDIVTELSPGCSWSTPGLTDMQGRKHYCIMVALRLDPAALSGDTVICAWCFKLKISSHQWACGLTANVSVCID